MLILSRADVESLLTMADTLAAVEEGFRRLAAGHVVMPQRAVTPIAPYHGLHLAMPAFAAGDGGDVGALIVKIVTVYGDNPSRHALPTIQGVLLYYDAATGRPLALMDAESLTALRTGSKAAVTIDEEKLGNQLMIRGTVTVTTVASPPPEYVLAGERYIGREAMQGWLGQLAGMKIPSWGRVAVKPEWVGVIDFKERFPSAIELAMGK
jgi:hypothetical protein